VEQVSLKLVHSLNFDISQVVHPTDRQDEDGSMADKLNARSRILKGDTSHIRLLQPVRLNRLHRRVNMRPKLEPINRGIDILQNLFPVTQLLRPTGIEVEAEAMKMRRKVTASARIAISRSCAAYLISLLVDGKILKGKLVLHFVGHGDS